jgi:hypothetical protein
VRNTRFEDHARPAAAPGEACKKLTPAEAGGRVSASMDVIWQGGRVNRSRVIVPARATGKINITYLSTSVYPLGVCMRAGGGLGGQLVVFVVWLSATA